MAYTANFVSLILHAAADMLERRAEYRRWHAGPEVWDVLHQAAQELGTAPAVEMLRRRIPASQVQFWDADKLTVIRTLREVAGGPLDLLEAQKLDAAHRIDEVRLMLLRALGWSECGYTFGQAARAVEDEFKQLRGQVDRLGAEVEDLRKQVATRKGAA